MNNATLYGIGIGPGDPELITLKAARLISECPVIAFPANGGGNSMAYDIARDCIPRQADLLPIEIPMTTEREPAQQAYNLGANKIATRLAEGKDVAFLCEGDPLFYASFMYLHDRICKDHSVKVIPGVTSLTACAAELGRPLAARNEVLKILPATLPAEKLLSEMETSEAIAIIKVGRHFDKIRKLLHDLNLTSKAAIIESATCQNQKISRLDDIPEGERPYFSTILVYRGEEGW